MARVLGVIFVMGSEVIVDRRLDVFRFSLFFLLGLFWVERGGWFVKICFYMCGKISGLS